MKNIKKHYPWIVLLIMVFAHPSLLAQEKKVLFILSSADSIPLNEGKKMRQTGVFLSEFYKAYQTVVDRGYQADFATPEGLEVSIDKESLLKKYWKDDEASRQEARLFIKEDRDFTSPQSLQSVMNNVQEYTALVIPGGQGLMVDLFDNEDVTRLLISFANEEKPIGLICHAPSLLINVPYENNPFTGLTVNAVSPFEELFIEKIIMKGKPKRRKIAKQLKEKGLRYICKGPKANFAVQDKFLVTSQNPYSGKAFSKLFLRALNQYEKHIEPNSKLNYSYFGDSTKEKRK